MIDQNKILACMAVRGQLSLDTICRHADPAKSAAIGTQHRRNVTAAVGRLVKAGLLARCVGTPAFQNKADVRYVVTAKGSDFYTDGRKIKPGAKGPRTGAPRKTGTVRERIWQALRLAKKATAAELVELVRQDGDADSVKVTENARKYLQALARAGIVAVLGQRAAGHAPSSNGFLRFALARDLGLKAPVTGARFVTDPNTGTRIDYRKEKRA